MTIQSNRKFFTFAIRVVLSTTTLAQSGGFDISRMDNSVDACDDFYRHANGNWLKKAEIPAAFPSWGTWDILGTHLREVSRDLLDAAMKDSTADLKVRIV